jgi:hypothetical protein
MTSTTIGYNGKVLCTPFERRGVEAIESKGFATAKHKTVFVGLTVIFGNGKDIYPGDTVFVNGEGQKTWGQSAVEVDGKQVCVCPPEQIVAVKRLLVATEAVLGGTSDDIHRKFDH